MQRKLLVVVALVFTTLAGAGLISSTAPHSATTVASSSLNRGW
jgi:hypothetical protein